MNDWKLMIIRLCQILIGLFYFLRIKSKLKVLIIKKNCCCSVLITLLFIIQSLKLTSFWGKNTRPLLCFFSLFLRSWGRQVSACGFPHLHGGEEDLRLDDTLSCWAVLHALHSSHIFHSGHESDMFSSWSVYFVNLSACSEHVILIACLSQC